MIRSVSILCLAAALAGGTALAQGAAPLDPARTVELELRQDGELVASPTVQMQVGRGAAVSVGAYSLRLRMERTAAQGYLIRSSLYRSDGGWTLVATPAVAVTEGEQTRMQFAGADGSDLSLAVLVR